MHRTLALVLCLGSLAWSWPVEKLAPSIAYFQAGDGGYCTAFSIHEAKHLFVTANHCEPFEGALLDGAPVTEVVDVQTGESGLAVFKADVAHPYPAMKLGKLPKRGDEVLTLGYTRYSPVLLLFGGHVIHPNATLDGEDVHMITAAAMPGMSGGPVVDTKGKVVGVIVGGIQFTPPEIYVHLSASYNRVATLFKKYAQ